MASSAPSKPPAVPGARAKALSPEVRAPALVPARMVNEVTYCERLMYIEWTQGEFADNHFTVEGRNVHARADSPGGALPPKPSGDEPASDGRPYAARTVWLSSERLGVTAKIDVVQGTEGGTVVPIEYKRGKVPSVAEQVYLPERVQVCVQALLLREQGYRCDRGAVYFAASRCRVDVPITEDLERCTLDAIAHARHVAELPAAPPPLEDSPKCLGCSLSGICLPDETNVLRGLAGEDLLKPDPPDESFDGPIEPDPWELAGKGSESESTPSRVRRLYPARDDRVPVTVQDPRTRVRVSGDLLVIQGPEGASEARLTNTSHVTLLGNAQITTQALRALFERGISVSFHTGGGWLLGRATGNASNHIALRIEQHRRADDEAFCLDMAQRFVVAKIKNCRTLLRRNGSERDVACLKQLKLLTRKAGTASSLDTLLGIEGVAAREYFAHWTGMLKAPDALGTFHFQSRNRRPPRDPINALLSFAYSLLTRELVHATAQVGLEPLLGFYHQPRFGRPALALDLMEEFRPLIADSVVLSCINNRVVGLGDFQRTGDACSLTASGRRRVIAAHERRMEHRVRHPWFGYRVGYRRVLEVQARLLTRVLLGEIEHYPAFVTR